jgi:Concanavalin A-like lectin/glucanases superfamily/Domain of unknown function (DUF2341)/Carboxypeptidase regulatory-like domain
MTIRLLLSALLFVFILGGCRSDSSLSAGGSVETTNGIAGIIKDSTGLPVANAEVMLLSSDHNPYLYANSQMKMTVLQGTTDSVGHFHFEKLDKGMYSVQSSHPSEGANLIIKNITVTAANGAENLEGLLVAPGKININLSVTGAKAEDYIYLPGTTHFYKLKDSDIEKNEVILENIPVALYQKILLVKKATNENQNLVASPIAVKSNSETNIGPSSAWSQKIKLFINTTLTGANITENVTQFPLLVRLDQSHLQPLFLPLFESSQSGGQDIRFTKSDGITPLPFEIDQWDSASGQAAIWVKMDTIYANDNQQHIFLFTGNPKATSLSQGPAVFNTATGFSGVWHLGDNAKSSNIADAVGLNPGTYRSSNVAANTDANSTIGGIVGRAISFNGSSQWVDLGKNKPFVNGTNAVTLSAWVKFRTFTGAQNILAFSQGAPASATWSVAQVHYLEKKYLEVGGRSNTQEELMFTTGSIPLSVNTWYQVTGVINYQKDSLFLYTNGNLTSAVQVNFRDSQTNPIADGLGAIGSEDNGEGSIFKGIIDEASVSKVARSSTWIKLNYESQKADSRVVELRR